jgi:hypothetical protein
MAHDANDQIEQGKNREHQRFHDLCYIVIQIQQYRPISFLNVSLKIFTKVGTIRISEIARKVIRPTQTTFMPGRFFSRVTGGEIPTACCIPLERPGQGMILQTYK